MFFITFSYNSAFITKCDLLKLTQYILIFWIFVLLSSGPNRGHYITIVKSHGFWLLFDDDIVEVSMLKVMSTTFVLMFSSLLGVKILIQNWVEIASLQSHSLAGMFISTLLRRKIVSKIINPATCVRGFFYFIATSNDFKYQTLRV